jgi:hypothetical protein
MIRRATQGQADDTVVDASGNSFDVLEFGSELRSKCNDLILEDPERFAGMPIGDLCFGGRDSSLVGNKWSDLSVGIAKPFYTTTQFLNIVSTKTLITCLDEISYRASLTGQCRTQIMI